MDAVHGAGRLLLAAAPSTALAALVVHARTAGWDVEQASPEQARKLLGQGAYDLVLVELSGEQAPESSARSLADWVARVRSAAVIALSSRPSYELALEALRAGARDFLELPVRPAELQRALDRGLGPRGAEHKPELASPHYSGAVMIGRSAALRRVQDQIDRVAAAARTTVLLLGESGTGKELAARAIHDRSARATGPFVALNCAALNEGLLEAELFGYEKGAFTGAAPQGHAGLLAAAQGGSLLLDEIGELALPLQAKLLRVLQERCFRRVGGLVDLPFDARILASTHRDLEERVARGQFREDLYYRLNVMSVRLPPLRERTGDIAMLAQHHLARLSAEMDCGPLVLEPAALRQLELQRWPGNVRELANCLERAALFAVEGRIGVECLASEQALGPGAGALDHADDLSLRAAEQRLLRLALERAGGNRSQAARLLGVNRSTLYEMLRRIDLPLQVGAGA